MMPVIVLGVICLVVAALLGAVNMLTAPVIEEAKSAAITESLGAVMEGGKFSDPDELPADAPKTVTAKYTDLNGNGYVVTLETSGYEADSLNLTVGVDTEGKITKVLLTKNAESKDTGKSNAYPEQFAGLDAAGVESVELIAGITKSTTAIKSAVYDALVVCGFAEAKAEGNTETVGNGGVTERSDEEVLALAKELVGSDSLEEVEIKSLPETTKKVYRQNNGGYVIYVATRTEYVALETEGLVATDKNGVITAVNLLTWTVGHGVGYDKAYLDSFIGKERESLASVRDGEDLGKVDLVTEATGTSEHFRDAVADALDAVFAVPVYSIIGICILCAAVGGVIAFAVVVYIKRRSGNEQQ